MANGAPALGCGRCGRTAALTDLIWRCECGGLLDLVGFDPRPPALADLAGRPPTLWRYAEVLPVPEDPGIGMGEGMTPVIPAPSRSRVSQPGVSQPGVGPLRVGLKMDFLMPTGSFKDRGAVLLAILARRAGASRIVADSSGNAGAAVAGYAARAGIDCDVYVPAATSAGKLGQLRAYGARVHPVEGTREDTAEAAIRAAGEPGVCYASHVYHPVFVHGTKTYVYELWEWYRGRLPDVLVLPVGNGTLVLGAHLGCRELLAHGLIERYPRIVAVQSDRCAPLARALATGADEPVAVDGAATVAEGIAIARPARGGQILAAIRDTGGTIVTVIDDQVRAAHAELARGGIHVEPTAAVCWAALRSGAVGEAGEAGAAGDAGGPAGGAIDPTEPPPVVAPLCGSGLKSKPPEAPRP